MMANERQLRKLINGINPRNRRYALALLSSERERILSAPGGLHKHQNWKGGYIDHLIETMSTACLLYEALKNQRRLNFTLSDALFILFLHDLEKVFKMAVDANGQPIRTPLADDQKYKTAVVIVKRLKIPLTKKQLNALTYVEGEKNDYHPTKRIMNPLAAFIHCCDTISARIWFDEPKKSGLMKKGIFKGR